MLQIFQPNQTFTTDEVAFNYGIVLSTLQKHKINHDDELIENIHYFYSYEQTKGGRQRIIRWTLEGVYMLGFFIKSQQAKIYRKKVAEFLRLCDEVRQKKFNEARATITEQISEISNLKAMQISRNNQINDYKSQISQKNDEILSLKQQILRDKKNEEAVILLGRANEKISEAYIEIQSIMANLCGDVFLKNKF